MNRVGCRQQADGAAARLNKVVMVSEKNLVVKSQDYWAEFV